MAPETVETLLAAGNSRMVDEQYNQALDMYTQALCVDPACADAYSKRAAVHLAMDNVEAALADADNALEKDPLLYVASLRRGIALVRLGRHAVALPSLKLAAEHGQSKARVWMEQCLSFLQEKPHVPDQAETLASKVRHSWVQKERSIEVTFYAKQLQEKNVEVTFGVQDLRVRLAMPDGSMMERRLQLYRTVDPSRCSFRLTRFKLLCHLEKKEQVEWATLEREEVQESNKAAGKNWSVLEKALEEEEKGPEGDAALTSLFQSIYAKADDDTRRAMIKSYQTSGGTVLSTNWNEVKEKDYENELEPPEGMKVNKWE